MLLSEAFTIAKYLLGEKGSYYWSDTETVVYGNRVYNYMQESITRYDSAVLVQPSGLKTYPANTERVDLTDVAWLGAKPRLISAVQWFSQNLPISGTNLPREVSPTFFTDLKRRYLTFAVTAPSGVMMVPTQMPLAISDYWYAITQEQYLYLAPYPTANIYLNIDYVAYKTPLTALSDTIDLPQRYVELFPMVLSWFMTTKEKRQTVSLDKVGELIKQQLDPAGPIAEATVMPYESPY